VTEFRSPDDKTVRHQLGACRPPPVVRSIKVLITYANYQIALIDLTAVNWDASHVRYRRDHQRLVASHRTVPCIFLLSPLWMVFPVMNYLIFMIHTIS
jgi:hypothetical protein